MRVIENPLEIRFNQYSDKLTKNRKNKPSECDDKCITMTVIFSFAYCRDHFLCQESLFKNILSGPPMHEPFLFCFESLFWSGTKRVAHAFSEFGSRFTTLEDTMAG